MVIPDISPELIIQASEAVFFLNKEVDVSEVSDFLELSPDYAEKALKAGAELSIIVENHNKYNRSDSFMYFSLSKRTNHQLYFRFNLNNFLLLKHFKERLFY